jgi:hypothetical protein
MLQGNTNTKSVGDITQQQEKLIKAFLQGAVYAWCNIKKTKPFFFRDLMGGDNFYWENTPLQVLYNKHINNGKSSKKAVLEAGKNAGMLLKMVLIKDKNKNFGQKKVMENVPRNKYYLIPEKDSD